MEKWLFSTLNMHTTNHALESSADWSLCIIAKKKKMAAVQFRLGRYHPDPDLVISDWQVPACLVQLEPLDRNYALVWRSTRICFRTPFCFCCMQHRSLTSLHRSDCAHTYADDSQLYISVPASKWLTGSHCRSSRTGATCSNRRTPDTLLAAMFCTDWSFWRWTGDSASAELQ